MMKATDRTITGVLTAVAMLAMVAFDSAWAGDLTPPGAPGATMHTLEEIYQRIGDLEARLDAAGMRETPEGMALIPAGEFVMGDTFGDGGSAELPLHTNFISAFYMDTTEVTKAKWDEVYAWATTNGYSFDDVASGKATNHPIHSVTWYDCVKWANARSEMEGLRPCYLAETTTGTVYRTGFLAPACDWYANGYRLPTEAEWEKAARGGAPGTRFPWTGVDTIRHTRANYSANGSAYSYDISPYTSNTYHPDYDSGGMPYTSPVGTFTPNGYGLYDMEGNMHEWCWDWYNSMYYASSPSTDPRGPTSAGAKRAIRGGYWAAPAKFCRVAYRDSLTPSGAFMTLGFRLVRAAQ
ncbi:MAG: SUMF1/EgtB/PvdO family nonheme iron enzyme [Kiritimatiellae bacterium]|nr:SUMF1/EgtB/PvdO family nonheme iron enzyme [Kiritimatiellia bacterium]MDY0150221.1 SUMF1/EgtB/PvdO family nonheme iron enzyme [Kiritimatiellia bacterium]